MIGITLNHTFYSKSYILNLEQHEMDDMPDYLQEIFNFLKDWFDDYNYIKAYTSGSTGKPKEIILSKEMMEISARATISFLSLKKGDNILLSLSAGYIAGKMMLVRALVGSFNVIVIRPESVLRIPSSDRINLAAMVPMQVEATLDEFGTGAFDLIDSLIIGGAVVKPELQKRLDTVKASCFATYGMTETASHVALRYLNGKESNGEIYNGLPGIIFKQDTRDCLVIDAPDLLGHLLVTNDIVELIDEKSFKWIGRYDFVINSGGIKLFPEKIEKKISSIMRVPFYLTKRFSDKLGEEMVLVLEKDNISEVEKTEMLEQISALVSKYEKPKDILFMHPFAYSDTGKILRLLPDIG